MRALPGALLAREEIAVSSSFFFAAAVYARRAARVCDMFRLHFLRERHAMQMPCCLLRYVSMPRIYGALCRRFI